MTRDEAIKVSKENLAGWPGLHAQAERAIDLYVALGMLKLDEPLSTRERFKLAMKAEGYNEACVGFCDALRAFDKAQ